MWQLKNLSTRKLFILYISLSALLMGGVGGVVIYRQSVKVVAQIQKETIQVELQTAKSYLLQYINDQEIAYRRITSLSDVIRAVSSDQKVDTQALTNQLAQAQIFTQKAQLALFDSHSQAIINQLDLPKSKVMKVVGRILTGSPSDVILQLVQRNQHQFFTLYLPVVAQQRIMGVMVAKLDFNLAYFFSTITSSHNRWIGLSQPSAGIDLFPRDRNLWQVYEIPLGYSDLIMNYAVSTHARIAQRNNLLYRLGSMLAISAVLALILIYLLGQRLLVRPFQELTRNREQLAQHSQLLVEREAEAKRLAQVAQHAHDAIVICDKRGLVTWVNPAFTNLTGYNSQEVLGKHPGTLLQGPDSDFQTRQRIGEALATQQSIRTEVLNYRKDGQSYWVDIDITPVLNSEGKLESFIAVQRDITEQRHLEESLRQALSRAKDANNAKLRFLAQMSHEIRTPMNGVLGIAQLLEQTELNEQQRHYLDDLYHSGQHMMVLLNDILDFSKIDAQQLQLESAPFSLTEVIDGVRSTYAALAKQQGIEFRLKTKLKEPNIIADRSRIRQIILNLVSNSMKFTQQGFVELTLKDLYSHQQLYLVIRIKDSGIGIEPKRQEQIFEAFTQAESSTTRLYGGSGLGLAIVRQLCQAMGGDIRLRSKPGQGAIFTAILQVKPTTSSLEPQKIAASQFKANQLPLLIAEDNRTNGMIIKAFFAKRGFQCALVMNGAQALETMQTRSYPVILMDNHMPEIDGIDATRQIRRMKAPECYALIIGCTADAYSDTRSEMLSAGVNDVLTKPLQNDAIDILLHRYEQHFRNWQIWRENSTELGLADLAEASDWLKHRPYSFRSEAITFLKQHSYLWDQLNAAIVDENWPAIEKRLSELLGNGEQLQATQLIQACHYFKQCVSVQKLPDMLWLRQFQHLQQNIHQRLHQWLELIENELNNPS
ncbi:ATP-binding protein [Celerinatantimonas sp. MCCC 1A17872]|uniref:hybrid sensor histidine kinase/response regulator n=1 Tax=Celerinatantimonas sp. MCCC 1A17872 TaxID=3177514 RepID=UPI0038C659B9